MGNQAGSLGSGTEATPVMPKRGENPPKPEQGKPAFARLTAAQIDKVSNTGARMQLMLMTKRKKESVDYISIRKVELRGDDAIIFLESPQNENYSLSICVGGTNGRVPIAYVGY